MITNFFNEIDTNTREIININNLVLEHIVTVNKLKDTQLQLIYLSTEHLLSRININGKYFSINDYEINNNIKRVIEIAQEGIFDRAINSVKLFFNSEEKIHENIIKSVTAIKEKGASKDLIKEPGYGRSFSRIGKDVITVADVIKTVEDYKRLVTSNDLVNVLKSYTHFIDTNIKELSNTKFITDSNSESDISELNSIANAAKNKADQVINKLNKEVKNDPDIHPVSINEAEKLSKEVQDILSNNNLNNALKNFNKAISNANKQILLERAKRVAGKISDLVMQKEAEAEKVIFKVNPALTDIMEIINRKDRLCFACVNYIKDSTVD